MLRFDFLHCCFCNGLRKWKGSTFFLLFDFLKKFSIWSLDYSKKVLLKVRLKTLWHHKHTPCCKCIGSLAYVPEVGIEGGKPLPQAFQFLIPMIWRSCDLNLVMISSLASKCQHFKLRGLQFHFIKWLKNGHPKFKVLAFWSQWRYHYQIQITRSLYQKNQILKC